MSLTCLVMSNSHIKYWEIKKMKIFKTTKEFVYDEETYPIGSLVFITEETVGILQQPWGGIQDVESFIETPDILELFDETMEGQELIEVFSNES